MGAMAPLPTRRARPFGLDLLLAAAIVGAMLLVAALLHRQEVSGPVRVVDGDTIAYGERRVRLKGIDAPELAQLCERGSESYRCGLDARQALAALVGAGLVTCRLDGRDRYGRDLGRCEAGGRDLGAELVIRGLAVAYGGYAREEDEARRRRLGVWAGRFERPAEWRRRQAEIKNP